MSRVLLGRCERRATCQWHLARFERVVVAEGGEDLVGCAEKPFVAVRGT
jgi:hypothetical protein